MTAIAFFCISRWEKNITKIIKWFIPHSFKSQSYPFFKTLLNIMDILLQKCCNSISSSGRGGQRKRVWEFSILYCIMLKNFNEITVRQHKFYMYENNIAIVCWVDMLALQWLEINWEWKAYIYYMYMSPKAESFPWIFFHMKYKLLNYFKLFY